MEKIDQRFVEQKKKDQILAKNIFYKDNAELFIHVLSYINVLIARHNPGI